MWPKGGSWNIMITETIDGLQLLTYLQDSFRLLINYYIPCDTSDEEESLLSLSREAR